MARHGTASLVLASVVCAVGGLIAGYLLPKQGHAPDADRFLYGSPEEIERIAESDVSEHPAFFQAIHVMLSGYRGRPAIARERKLLLLDVLGQGRWFDELALALALGAAGDDAPEVRQACVAVLLQWQDSLADARHMIERNISRETDDSVRRKKESFLLGSGQHAAHGGIPDGSRD